MKRRAFITGLAALPFIGKAAADIVPGHKVVAVDWNFTMREFYDVDAMSLVAACRWRERHDGVWSGYVSYWYIPERGTYSFETGRKQLVYADGRLVEMIDV